MATATPIQNRSSQRHALEIEVTVASDHNFYTGFTQNISEGGLFIATSEIQPIGSILEFELSLSPGKQVVKLKGEVRWVRETDEYNAEAPNGMGLRFIDLDPRIGARINQFIEGKRDALFFDDDDF